MYLLKIFALLLLLLTLSLSANNQKLDKLKLQLQWKHQFEFAGFYAAKEKGFYKEVGLDVEFIEFEEKTDITHEVLSSKADYGLSYSSIIADYMNGKSIIMVANFFKQSPLVLVTQKNIKTLADLKNKKVMGLSNSIHNITLFGMLDKFHVKSTDIINIPTTFTIDDFINKKVDAMSAFTTNEIYELDKRGAQYNLFDPVVYGAKYYDVNLFTTLDESINHPSRVQKMKEASIRGWEYALKNKEEVVALILQKYNSQNKTREALLFEAQQIENLILPHVYDIGIIDKDRIRTIFDNFKEAGFIKNDNSKRVENFIFKDKSNPLSLSKKEKIFILNHPKIVLGTDKRWEPYVLLSDDGVVSGYDAEVLSLISELSGLDFELKAGDWAEMQIEAKKRTIDGLSTGGVHKERQKYLNFSDIYITMQKTIITTLDNPKNIQNIEDLKGHRIAIHKSNLVDEKIAQKMINSKIIRLDNQEDIFNYMLTGKADAAFGNGTTIYLANKIGFPYFKHTANLDETLKLAFGIRKDWPEAVSIINKSLNAIGENRLLEIKRKWFYLENKKEFDYILFAKFAGVLILIVLIFLYRQYNIKRLNIELKKRVEEELKKSRDKDKMIFHQSKLISMGEMIENIAHQWRQPLSQINSAVLVIDDTLVQSGYKGNLVEEKLSEIESLTKYMSNTIDDFKDFYAQDKLPEFFLLRDVISESISILGGTFKSNSIEIGTDIEEDYLCNGYPSELKQVLVVILNNAQDILTSREVNKAKIDVAVEKSSKYYTISISDNAGGIEKEIIDKVFDPYFTTKHKTQGTGLGLYISKMIIEDSLLGELSVQNTENGACFKIKLKRIKDLDLC